MAADRLWVINLLSTLLENLLGLHLPYQLDLHGFLLLEVFGNVSYQKSHQSKNLDISTHKRWGVTCIFGIRSVLNSTLTVIDRQDKSNLFKGGESEALRRLRESLSDKVWGNKFPSSLEVLQDVPLFMHKVVYQFLQ